MHALSGSAAQEPARQVLARIAGHFAARGEGEVCAVFKRSFYLRFAGNSGASQFACVGDPSIGRGPLNAIVDDFRAPALGQRIALSADSTWEPVRPVAGFLDLTLLRDAARGRTPAEGLGCLVAGTSNALCAHAQPALDAIDEWLAGNALDARIAQLIGLGPGLTPSGDDYLGGVMVALHSLGRNSQSTALWRWLEPRLAARTSAISAAHLAAAAAGQAHEALHRILAGEIDLDALDAVGHCSGWDALAGAVAVLRQRSRAAS
jgi:hypothetical protein